MKLLSLFLFLGSLLVAQQVNLAENVYGSLPAGVGIAIGTSLPATCATGQVFFKTNATAGQNWYGCTSTNTWTLQSGTGSPAGYTTVTFSATPTFTASSTTGTSFLITLTGNVTSSTLAAASSGQIITMNICQDGTGSRTFVFPTTMLNAGTIDGTASACTHQVFIFDGTNAQALAPAYVTGPVGGRITMPGATSGSTVLQPAAISGSSVVTLPAATDTLMGKATTDIVTGKTFDTAGSGNVFRINGVQISDVNGSGKACLETGSTCGGGAFSGITTGTNAAALHVGTGGTLDATGSGTITATSTNGQGAVVGTAIGFITLCASAASPAVCSTRTAGAVVIAAGATSVVVNTSAMTAISLVTPIFDSSLGAVLGVTCNTTFAAPWISARTAGVSFTITVGAAPVTNPACYSFEFFN